MRLRRYRPVEDEVYPNVEMSVWTAPVMEYSMAGGSVPVGTEYPGERVERVVVQPLMVRGADGEWIAL